MNFLVNNKRLPFIEQPFRSYLLIFLLSANLPAHHVWLNCKVFLLLTNLPSYLQKTYNGIYVRFLRCQLTPIGEPIFLLLLYKSLIYMSRIYDIFNISVNLLLLYHCARTIQAAYHCNIGIGLCR